MKLITSIHQFNRGIISRLALARVDIKRVAMSASQMVNWIPRVLGSMMLRPGLAHIGSTYGNNKSKFIPFVFATSDTALIEFTDKAFRVWINDALVSRVAVSTAITNGGFNTNITSWTDVGSGGVSDWVASPFGGGFMRLQGTLAGTAAAREQQVTVAAGDIGKEHALQIWINRGPVTIRVGSTSGADDYITETDLGGQGQGGGIHSLAFTPTGNFFVRLQSRLTRYVYVDLVTIEPVGAMVLNHFVVAADLPKIRYDQSGSIIYCACAGYQQFMIERYSSRSWAIVLYSPEKGPFRNDNVSSVFLTPSALYGNVTLTATDSGGATTVPYFKSTNVGSLFRLTTAGQTVTALANGVGHATAAIQITGLTGHVFDPGYGPKTWVAGTREFAISVQGTFVATITLQKSIYSSSGPWTDVTGYSTAGSLSFDDKLDNQIIWYQLICTAYTSGAAQYWLYSAYGSVTGVCRVTDFTDTSHVNAEVLQPFGGTSAVNVWAESSWSPRRGYPSSVAFYEGRLWWAGKNGIWGSVSDSFDGFDPAYPGDAGSINRTIGNGPVDNINWLVPAQRLIIGTEGAEMSARSTSFDEPLTPTNFNIKAPSTLGSASVAAVKIDSRAAFVQRAGTRVYELALNPYTYDYAATELTALIPEIAASGIVTMAVQRQPDTRIHCVLNDGTVAVAVLDRVENVLSWQIISVSQIIGFTGDIIEDVVVLPAVLEDSVYYVVKRTVNGATVRYLEKWALETECVGSTLNKQADSFVLFNSSAPTVTVSGLSHLEGRQVVVWGDGKDLSPGTGLIKIIAAINVGSTPSYIAIDPPGARAYVTNFGGTTITIIDTDTYAILGSITTAAAPVWIAITPDGQTAYVTLSGNTVAEIDISTNTLTATITVGNTPVGIAITPTGEFAYVANYADGTVKVIDILAGAVVATITVGTNPYGVTMNREGSKVYVANSGASTVSVISTVSNTVTGTINVGSGPRFICINSIDSKAYVGNFGGGTVSVVDTGTNSIAATVTVGTNPAGIAITPDDQRVIVTDNGGTAISVIDTVSNLIVATAVGGAGLYGIAITPDGTGAFIAGQTGNYVVVVTATATQTFYTVKGGLITLTSPIQNAVVGLPYFAQWQSSKLASLVTQETGLNQRKKVSQTGLILANTHSKGVQYGPDFDHLDDMPNIESGALVSYDTVYDSYDKDMLIFPGEWSTDSRVCLQANAPRPCTALALAIAMEEHGKS